jgi:methionyl-tRNA formyltransferase
VTVHLLDEGIDTGPVVAQARVEPTPDDNFATYPLLQLATALPLLEYHHPTIGEYWHARVRYGVR